MSTELIETPAEIENDAEEPKGTEATDSAVKTESEPAKTPEQLEIERLKKEISHKERSLTKRDRTQGKLYSENEQLRARLEALEARQPADDEPKSTPTREQLQEAIRREAKALAALEKFNDRCDDIAETGKREFKDFPDALKALIEEAGPLVTPDGATPLGDLILDSDEPAKLIHYLGKNPEIAAELDGLTPGRMARKLASIELAMEAKPKTSAAPKPLEPVTGKASPPKGYHKDMTDAEYAAWSDGLKRKK
jgi:hypothetical protein